MKGEKKATAMKGNGPIRTLPGLLEGQILEVGGHQLKYDGSADWGAELGILDGFTLLTPGMETSLLIAADSSDQEFEAMVRERVALFRTWENQRKSALAV